MPERRRTSRSRTALQCVHDGNEFAERGRRERSVHAPRGGGGRAIRIGPRPLDPQGRSVRQANDQVRLARRRDFQAPTFERVMSTNDGDSSQRIPKVIRSL